jgi:hypothetical protein
MPAILFLFNSAKVLTARMTLEGAISSKDMKQRQKYIHSLQMSLRSTSALVIVNHIVLELLRAV